MSKELIDAIDVIASRFRSGNRIPVDKAVVPAGEWNALVAALAAPPVEQQPCTKDDQRGCWRVRCQLAKKCEVPSE